MRILLFILFLAFVATFQSCQKEIDWGNILNDTTNGGGGSGGGGGGGGGGGTSCTGTKKLKRFYPVVDSQYQLTIQYDGSGRLSIIRNELQGSDKRTAVYQYTGTRITSAILITNATNAIEDTIYYRYDAAGRVDSMYLKNDDYFNVRYIYTAAGLIDRVVRYDGTNAYFYVKVTQRDGNGNILKAERWDQGGPAADLLLEFTRDDKKNPLVDIIPYMMYLEDEDDLFRFWGPNNYKDELFIYPPATGAVTGLAYTYQNCYPVGGRVTIAGVALFPDDDFKWEYY